MKKQLLSILGLLFISIAFAQPAPVGCVATEWDGTSWDPVIPSANPLSVNSVVIATISGNYDTETHGSFICCELIINELDSVRIAPSTYIQVQDSTKVNGNLLVEHRGSFIQRENNPNNFVLGPNGTATVKKEITTLFSTAVTYWSTPIAGQNVAETFNDTPSYGGYRYYFITENFQDLTYEEFNDNTINPGVGIDGIDDDGNAWNFATPLLNIIPGTGYATRQAPGADAGMYEYEFSGIFNNGTIEVPATRNDDNLSAPAPGGIDANPIFVGNPYASAISLEAFLTENTYDDINNTQGIIDGYVAVWSASAPPVNTNNGNEDINFSEADYFFMNFSGTTFNVCDALPFNTCDSAGLPDVFPEPAISSAQGFFVNFSDDVPGMSPTRNVVFNNTMRDTIHNNNFYKNTSAGKSTDISNKLWLNLNSPSGVNENVLLSYVDGATSGNDGKSYDLDLRTPITPYSLIYFNIDDSDEKFRIQGKNPSDLNLDEEVSLGFFNSAARPDGTPEEFAISITKMQGDFINNDAVFLYDNLLSVCHNLSDAPYFYTSGVGDFNDRFTIKFLECNFTEACNTIFDAFAGSIRPQGKCGKYRIKAPKGDYTGYDVVLTHEGTDINIPTNGANTTFSFTENGNYTVVLSIYDKATEALCYRGDVDIVVDCFRDRKKAIKLFPNPAKDAFKVSFSNPSEKVQGMLLRNLMGTVVKQSNSNNMRVDNLKPGVYFVEVTTKTGEIYRKQLVVK